MGVFDKKCLGESSSDQVHSTYVKEFCDDPDKIESNPWKLEPGFTQDTHQNEINSPLLSVLCIEDNRAASVTVSDEYASTTHQESDVETTLVSNSSPLTTIHKVILLSSADESRSQPHDGDSDDDRDGLLCDKTRQLLVTSPVNAKTIPCDGDRDRSLCEKTRQLTMTPPVNTETFHRAKMRGLLVTASVKLATTASAVPNVTVQTSSSYASRFVLPRETSTFSNKQLGFIEIASDISQPTGNVLQLTRNNGVTGRHPCHSLNCHQGRPMVKSTWNRPHLRARPLGRVLSAGKRLKCRDERTSAGVSRCFTYYTITYHNVDIKVHLGSGSFYHLMLIFKYTPIHMMQNYKIMF